VAILIESQPLKSDVTAMFDHETYAATTGVQPPGFRVVDVDGGAPFDAASGGAFEASLDVQQVLGGAPGADVTIVSLPDLSDQSILDGFTYIVEANRWAIVSDSFGSCELLYTAAYNNGVDYTSILTTFDEEFRQGAAQGITFISSSGDSGGLGCPDVSYLSGGVHAKFIPAVESPADDPYVTAVGGGNLLTTAPNLPALTSKYVHENAEGDREITYDPYGVGNTVAGGYFGAGGGVSVVFAQPTYQTPVMAAPGRLLPDVGMLVGGCPSGLAIAPCGPDRSAAIVTFNGVRQGVVGTSVAAPEFASAVALYVEASGQRVGTLNPYLWRMGGVQNALGGVKAAAAAQFFHKNIEGYDGYYRQTTATPIGLMDGNGTPNVRTLFGLTAYPAAGAPRSASNP
jgi:subtilase family serine protease